MIKPRIIVTGATGKTGNVVVTELLKEGYLVRALVRREDGRSARLKGQGAEIAVADVSDAERVADALKDVQRAYYCPFRSLHDSRCGRLRGRSKGSTARTHRRYDAMVGEPVASLAHDPAALAGRSAVLDNARSRTYDCQAGHFR